MRNREHGALLVADQNLHGLWFFRSDATTNECKAVPVESWDFCGVEYKLLVHGSQGLALSTIVKDSTSTTTFSTAASNGSAAKVPDSEETQIPQVKDVSIEGLNPTSSKDMTGQPTTHQNPSNSILDISPKSLHALFIEAVLASVAFFLCKEHGFLPLNARTLFFPSYKTSWPGSKDAAQVITLDVSITSLGHIITKASAQRVRAFTNCPNDTTVPPMDLGHAMGSSKAALWLAPLGRQAWYYGPEPGVDSILGSRGPENCSQGSTSPSNIQVNSAWKSRLLTWLQACGVNAETVNAAGWLIVHIPTQGSPDPSSDTPDKKQSDVTLPWPALLCFRSSTMPEQTPFRSTIDPDKWQDPLEFAEKWSSENDKRAAIIQQRQEERQRAEGDHLATTTQPDQAHSAAAFAVRGAMHPGTVYPTPPDGVHGPLVGVTPSIDGTGMTPNQHQPVDAPTTQSHNLELDTREFPEVHKPPSHRASESSEKDDHLFADLSGDLFGETDITDADFSFFDDQPSVSQSEQVHQAPRVDPVTDCELLAPTSLPAPAPEVNAPPDSISPGGNEVTKCEDEEPIRPPSTSPGLITPPPTSANATELSTAKPLSTADRFDVSTIFEQLAQTHPLNVNLPHDNLGRFRRVDFNITVDTISDKYRNTGPFYMPKRQSKYDMSPTVSQTAVPCKRRLRRPRKRVGLTNSNHSPQNGILAGDEEKFSDMVSCSLSANSDTSISDDDFRSSHSLHLVLTSNSPKIRKRKRTGNNHQNSLFTKDIKENGSNESFEVDHDTLSEVILPGLQTEDGCWPLVAYLTANQADSGSDCLSDLEYVATAQILVDQATIGTAGLFIQPSTEPYQDPSTTRNVLHYVRNAASTCSMILGNNSFTSYLGIPGPATSGQGLRMAPRVGGNLRNIASDTSRPNSPFPIPPPHLTVRRADSELSVLPPAIPFWDTLGLVPVVGPKDVVAICLCPDLPGIEEHASTFLSQMRSSYESLRFGSHDHATSVELSKNVFTYDLRALNFAGELQHLIMLKEIFAMLSKELLSSTARKKNFVIYTIIPPCATTLIIHICCAFKHLFDMYWKGLRDRNDTCENEIVLQLVALEFVASLTSLTIVSPNKYGRLAMEAYDRCLSFSSLEPTPAIVIEKSLPRSIDFKLASHHPISLSQDEACIHIAYAPSYDGRWISAAWIDPRGCHQTTMSYCFGRQGQVTSTSFADIANEIWQMTMDIIGSKRSHHRIFVAKVGAMDSSEVDVWRAFLTAELQPSVTLTLITVQTRPTLQLLPDIDSMSREVSTEYDTIKSVAASQSTALSPKSPAAADSEMNSNKAFQRMIDTAGETAAEFDGNSRLVDLTDQTWGAVLSHRLNNSLRPHQNDPTLASGYLVKRSGLDALDAMLLLEVSIVYSEVVGNPRTFHDVLLREILASYRGLATLARARGMVDATKDTRPWHIAAVEKAVKALYIMM